VVVVADRRGRPYAKPDKPDKGGKGKGHGKQ
jgi:hypothetical protein